MRAIGAAEYALEALCARAKTRRVFGQLLSQKGKTEGAIADSRIELDQARLLVLHAAKLMDAHGNKLAQQAIGKAQAEPEPEPNPGPHPHPHPHPYRDAIDT
jgi:acyl-CoA dehydrogenase